MLQIILYVLSVLSAVSAATSGCIPSSIGSTGFTARFYSYGYRDTSGWDADFFSTGYKTTLMETVTEVTAINFDLAVLSSEASYGYVYGYYTTVSNFAVELSAFYLAPSTGTFTFNLAADNGASLQFGSGQGCCNDASGSVSGAFSIDTLGPAGGGGSTSENTQTASFSLTEGVYYPIKIVMFNWVGNAGLSLTMTDPSGNTVSDLGPYVSQLTFDNS
ncbi:hypothetical protein METBIDRAFT_34690, partial [Metschnikowia bicuspidata var. bicuspidata NRRL YB-4993]